jgi:PAS domain S-box-containing protein
MTPEGEAEFVNNQALEYFGKSIEELKGWATSDAVHPDDLPQAVAAWRHSVETGDPYDVDHRLRRADGVYRWFHSRGLALRDAKGRIIRWYNLLTDIDERRRAEEKLRNENVALRQEIDKASMLEEIVGTSAPLQMVLSRISKVAPTDSSVLITIKAISEEFMAALVEHSWPGNVRELQNVIERSVILSTSAVLSGSLPKFTGISKLSGAVTLKEAERSHILQILHKTQGVVGGRYGAAARLGLSRTTLISKMKRLGINRGQSSALPVRAAASVPISEDPICRISTLTENSHEAASPAGNSKPQSDLGRVFTLLDAEREHISQVVEMTDGLIAGEGGAADVLGVPPSTLRSRMKKLGIKFFGDMRQP